MSKIETYSKYFLNNNEIYSLYSNKILCPRTNKNGYKQVTVKDDAGKRHTMNYARFLLMLSDPQEDYSNLEVDHIDRDKLNDNLYNLRWVSLSENRKNRQRFKRPNVKRPIIIIKDTGEELIYTYGNKENFEYCYNTIYALANAKEGKHYSKKWKITCKYYDE